MKQKTAAIKFLRTKIAAGYVLILILIFSIVYIWFKEHHKLEEMKEASHKISCLRQNIHDIYVRAVDLSLIGETILNWDDEDIELYHTKRLEVDTLLYFSPRLFSSILHSHKRSPLRTFSFRCNLSLCRVSCFCILAKIAKTIHINNSNSFAFQFPQSHNDGCLTTPHLLRNISDAFPLTMEC